MEQTSPFHLQKIIREQTAACPFLAEQAQLSKSKVKDAMIKGAVWMKRGKNKEKRIRKAQFVLRPGDRVDLYYDAAILAQSPPPPRLVLEEQHYSIWYKPAMLLTQGTRYGDHVSLMRAVEKHFDLKKDIKLVHRLDREASGLVLFAHSRAGAAALSKLFQQGKIVKKYSAQVHGEVCPQGATRMFTEKLDGKKSTTQVTCRSYDSTSNVSDLAIRLFTGRYHQIRRHLSMAGHPILGDARYGKRKKRRQHPLQLVACALIFTCPFSGKLQDVQLDLSE